MPQDNPKKDTKSKRAHRPANEVYTEKLSDLYQASLKLIAKFDSVSRHRGLSDRAAMDRFNKLADRVSSEIAECKVSAPVVPQEIAAKSLDDFLAGK